MEETTPISFTLTEWFRIFADQRPNEVYRQWLEDVNGGQGLTKEHLFDFVKEMMREFTDLNSVDTARASLAKASKDDPYYDPTHEEVEICRDFRKSMDDVFKAYYKAIQNTGYLCLFNDALAKLCDNAVWVRACGCSSEYGQQSTWVHPDHLPKTPGGKTIFPKDSLPDDNNYRANTKTCINGKHCPHRRCTFYHVSSS